MSDPPYIMLERELERLARDVVRSDYIRPRLLEAASAIRSLRSSLATAQAAARCAHASPDPPHQGSAGKRCTVPTAPASPPLTRTKVDIMGEAALQERVGSLRAALLALAAIPELPPSALRRVRDALHNDDASARRPPQ